MLTGIIAGYGVHFRQLTSKDVSQWGIDLQGHPVNQCIAIDGSDLGPCLAAAVAFDEDKPTLLWSDRDGKGAQIPELFAQQFADSVVTVASEVLPHLREC